MASARSTPRPMPGAQHVHLQPSSTTPPRPLLAQRCYPPLPHDDVVEPEKVPPEAQPAEASLSRGSCTTTGGGAAAIEAAAAPVPRRKPQCKAMNAHIKKRQSLAGVPSRATPVSHLVSHMLHACAMYTCSTGAAGFV